MPPIDTRNVLMNNNPAFSEMPMPFAENPIISGIKGILRMFPQAQPWKYQDDSPSAPSPIDAAISGVMDRGTNKLASILKRLNSVDPSNSIVGDLAGLDKPAQVINPFDIEEGGTPEQKLVKNVIAASKGGGKGAAAAAKISSGLGDVLPADEYMSPPPVDDSSPEFLNDIKPAEDYASPPKEAPLWSDAFNYGAESEIDLPSEYEKIFSKSQKEWKDLPQYKPYTEGMHWSQLLGDMLTRAGQRAAGYDPVALRDRIENQKRRDVQEERNYEISKLDKETQNKLKILEARYNEQEKKRGDHANFLQQIGNSNPEVRKSPQFWAQLSKLWKVPPEQAKNMLKDFVDKDGKLTKLGLTQAELQVNAEETMFQHKMAKLKGLGMSDEQAEYAALFNDANYSSYLKSAYRKLIQKGDNVGAAKVAKELKETLEFEKQFDPQEIERNRVISMIPAIISMANGDPDTLYENLGGVVSYLVGGKWSFPPARRKATGAGEGKAPKAFERSAQIAANYIEHPNDPKAKMEYDNLLKTIQAPEDTSPMFLLTATNMTHLIDKLGSTPTAGMPYWISQAAAVKGNNATKLIEEYSMGGPMQARIQKNYIVPYFRSKFSKEMSQIRAGIGRDLSDKEVMDIVEKLNMAGKTALTDSNINAIISSYKPQKGA